MELVSEIQHIRSNISNLEGEDLIQKLFYLGTLNEQYEQVILKYLLDGNKTFKSSSLKQEGFVSVSAKANNLYQFTYFDNKGAVGDMLAKDFETLAKKINNMGFYICHHDDLEILY